MPRTHEVIFIGEDAPKTPEEKLQFAKEQLFKLADLDEQREKCRTIIKGIAEELNLDEISVVIASSETEQRIASFSRKELKRLSLKPGMFRTALIRAKKLGLDLKTSKTFTHDALDTMLNHETLEDLVKVTDYRDNKATVKTEKIKAEKAKKGSKTTVTSETVAQVGA